MTAYYNEIDPFAAQWLRNLIAAGHIAPGDVDERSIEDVTPDDLKNYTQCHFFAGIGVWSYALRRAGWPDDKPVWTGSCPCQPFSAAGKGAGFADERHLWPSFAWLIEQSRPSIIFGEQVASKAIDAWIDLVQADVEGMGYAFASTPFPSAGVGAPHVRDRNFWVADNQRAGFSASSPKCATANPLGGKKTNNVSSHGGIGSLGDAAIMPFGAYNRERQQSGEQPGETGGHGVFGRLAHSIIGQQRQIGEARPCTEHERSAREKEPAALTGFCSDLRALPVNGFWRDADWIYCRDKKWRPIEPGTFPLANGVAARVGRLRAYGNAINAEAAKEFIAAYMEAAA
ncbi:DNA cytosine methyltransferase [Brenneria roseae subsp. americana]|uniref:DNA cytosine methyltransferase n=1 Tax=Brenneria roseae subsp. americana TaxID=1508507 RepID=A0A2U1TND5_9GAMM|nr:DNA cytosine methyltransferase [Brenneria roseae]PWC10917.1 DNA cytosine methyltransferase [Brenneria roseae subsp. americana]